MPTSRHRSHLSLQAARRASPVQCFLGSYTYDDSMLLQDYFLITQKLKAEEAEAALGGLEAILPLPSENCKLSSINICDDINFASMPQFKLCFLTLLCRYRTAQHGAELCRNQSHKDLMQRCSLAHIFCDRIPYFEIQTRPAGKATEKPSCCCS